MTELVALAEEADEIQSCYQVMAELRPHIASGEFLTRVQKQAEIADYKLAYPPFPLLNLKIHLLRTLGLVDVVCDGYLQKVFP